MAILDFVYEQDLNLFFLADNQGQIRALGNVENFMYDTTMWKIPQEAGNTRKVLANSLAVLGEEGEVLEIMVLSGIGDLFKLCLDTKRIYDSEGYKWVKISNNLNNADHIYEDFSNNQLVANSHYAVAPFLKGKQHMIRVFDLCKDSDQSEKFMDLYVKDTSVENFHSSTFITEDNKLVFISSGYASSNLINIFQINDEAELHIRAYNARGPQTKLKLATYNANHNNNVHDLTLNVNFPDIHTQIKQKQKLSISFTKGQNGTIDMHEFFTF